MALKALICPQCGASLQLEDNREFGFCEFCGTKVIIREVSEVRHTLDFSEQMKNIMELADREFRAGDYEEAYNHYRKALELNSNDPVCIARRAISRVYLGFDEPLLRAFVKDITSVQNPAYEAGNEELIWQIDKDLSGVFQYYSSSVNPNRTSYPTKNDCINQVGTFIQTLTLARYIAPIINNEAVKSKLLSEVVALCDSKFYVKMKYVDRSAMFGLATFSLNKATLSRIKQDREDLVEEYRSMK